MTDRTCVTCGVTQPLSSFPVRSDTGKHKRRCRECDNEWHKANYQKIKEKKKAAAKTHYSKPEVKEQRKAYRAARKLQDKVWKKNWDLQRHYGIDLAALDATLEAQHCHCPICARYFPKNSRAWHVDHDHDSGKVRGVICTNCNTMLGQSQDNPDTLRRAAEYLEKNK